MSEENNKLIEKWVNPGYEDGQDWSQYHKDWDALMSVVEKIDSLVGEDFTLVKIERNYCQIVNQKAPIISVASKDKISAVYDAVTQFINWHNQQTP